MNTIDFWQTKRNSLYIFFGTGLQNALWSDSNKVSPLKPLNITTFASYINA